MKFSIKDRVIFDGYEGKIISIPPAKGTEVYVVLLDNGKGFLVPVDKLEKVEIEND